MGHDPENPNFNKTSSEDPSMEQVSQDYAQKRSPRRSNNFVEYGPNGELYQGSAVRLIRLQRGISISELAGLMLWNPSSLSKIETNRLPASSKALKKIAGFLGVSEDDLKQAPLHPKINRQKSNRAASTISTSGVK